MMRTKGVLVTLLMTTMALAGCTGDFGTEEAPQWRTGYAFSHDWTADAEFSYFSNEDGETEEEGSDGVETETWSTVMEVLDTDIQAGRHSAYLGAMQFADGLNGAGGFGQASPVAIRHHDLGVVYPSVSSWQNCVNDVCEEGFDYEFDDDYDDYTYLDFPLKNGKTWSYDIGDDDFFAVTIHSTVKGMKSVELPVGRTDAIRIDSTVEVGDFSAFQDELRAELEQAGIEIKKLEFSIDAEVRTYYSPAYQTVVKEVGTFHERGHIIIEFEGERVEERFDAEGTVEQILTGARLIERPVRSADSIQRVFTGSEPILDPTGETVPEDPPYSITVSVSDDLVNAAASPVVTLRAVPQGVDRLPDDHTVAWRITDAGGFEAAAAEGVVTEITLDEPGIYTIQAIARNSIDTIIASAGSVVVADYEARIPAACALASLAGIPGGCDTVSVPVRAGITDLRVGIELNGPVPFALGTLILQDPHGGAESTSGTSIVIEDFAGRPISGADWSLNWAPTLEVLEDATYVIDLAYGLPPQPAFTAPVEAPAGIIGQFQDRVENLQENLLDLAASPPLAVGV